MVLGVFGTARNCVDRESCSETERCDGGGSFRARLPFEGASTREIDDSMALRNDKGSYLDPGQLLLRQRLQTPRTATQTGFKRNVLKTALLFLWASRTSCLATTHLIRCTCRRDGRPRNKVQAIQEEDPIILVSSVLARSSIDLPIKWTSKMRQIDGMGMRSKTLESFGRQSMIVLSCADDVFFGAVNSRTHQRCAATESFNDRPSVNSRQTIDSSETYTCSTSEALEQSRVAIDESQLIQQRISQPKFNKMHSCERAKASGFLLSNTCPRCCGILFRNLKR